MILNCSKCGAPYTGGVICEKCGTRFNDDDIAKFEQAVREQQSYNQFRAEKAKESDNKAAKIILTVFAIFTGFIVLSILVAIFVPAYIGYNAKRKAHEESQRMREENSSYSEEYDEYYSDDE